MNRRFFQSAAGWTRPRTLWQFAKFVYTSFHYHQGLENAKSLTYTSLFSVVPLLTVIVAVLSAFPSFQVFGTQVQNVVFQRLLPATTEELQEYLTRFMEQARNLTWVGAMMLMVTSYFMLVNIERSFNRIWGVGEVRKGLYSFLLYWSVLSLGPLLLGLAFGISSYVTSLALFDALSEVTAFVGVNTVVLSVFPVLLSVLAFTLLYLAVPNTGVRLIHAFAGGLTVALAFIVVKNIFTRFIAMASFEFVYGTFAAVPIFLIWLYVCWVVILAGANLVRSIPLFLAQRQRTGVEVHPTLLLLALLNKLWCCHQEGGALNMEDLGMERWPFTGVKLEEFLDLLSRHKVVHASTQGDYLLARDLRTLPMWQLLAWLPWPLPEPEDFERPLPDVVKGYLARITELRMRFAALEQCARGEFGESLDEFFREQAEQEAGPASHV